MPKADFDVRAYDTINGSKSDRNESFALESYWSVMRTDIHHEDVSHTCPSVDLPEMAFAIALFVGAVDGRVLPTNSKHLEFAVDFDLDPTLIGAKSILSRTDAPSEEELPLSRAVAVIWQHYAGDPRRQAICSRLVAFYSMMIKDRGGVLDKWVQQSPEDSSDVILDSSLVEAVATVSISDDGQFPYILFVKAVEAFVARDNPNSRSMNADKNPLASDENWVAVINVTERTKALAEYLVAFETCIAGPQHISQALEFRVFAKLCKPFAAIAGDRALQPMLLRALGAARADFPWLEAATVTLKGSVPSLDNAIRRISEPEAAAGELAAVASLVELLLTFLGVGVTVQLLRSIWPLAPLIHFGEVDLQNA